MQLAFAAFDLMKTIFPLRNWLIICGKVWQPVLLLLTAKIGLVKTSLINNWNLGVFEGAGDLSFLLV